MEGAFSRFSLIIGLLAFLVVGCGDTVAGGGGSGGIGAAGGAGGTRAEPVTLLLSVVTASLLGPAPPALGPPLEGARVCELGTENCETSDERGKVILDLPGNQEVAYTIEKEGYGPRIISDVTDENFPSTTFWEMFTDAQLGEIAEAIGTPYPWTGGIPGLNLASTLVLTLVGAKLQMVDGSGKPFYLEDAATWLYSPDLDATQVSAFGGFRPLAVAGFAEVPPGVHEFEVVGGVGCSLLQGWPGDGPNRIRIPIVEGFNTYGSLICEGVETP
jgi:hypothetical protein